MSADLLIPLTVTIVLVGVWAVPTVVLLKQKYVLFAVGLVIVLASLATVTVAGALSYAAAGVGLLVWIVAAVRLAPPASRWAKQLYGEAKAVKARERPAGAATTAWERKHGIRTPDHAPAPAPPRSLVVGAVLTVVGLVVVGVIGGVRGGIVPGAALPLLWLVRARWRRGRTIVTVLAVLGVANTVYNLTAGGAAPAPFWIAFTFGVLLLVAGLVVLYRALVGAYLVENTC